MTEVEKLVVFCQQAGRRVFPDWPAVEVLRWVKWHVERNSVIVVHNAAGQIVGMGAGLLHGEDFVFEKVVTRRPGVLRQLVAEFKRRYPQWIHWRLWEHGRGGNRRVTGRWLERIERLN